MSAARFDTPQFTSESGLRPMSAFVVIAFVIAVAAGWVVRVTYVRGASQPERIVFESGVPPAYAISDREGRPVARFVPRFDLEMSPRSMWQAHTPGYMAEQIAAVVGDTSAGELLEAMLPDAEDGVVEADLPLSARQANRVTEWITGGEREPLEGIWVERQGDGSFHLFWRPAEVLSQEQRERQGYGGAWLWARRVATQLDRAIRPPSDVEPRTAEEWDARRAEIWKALLPTAFTRPITGLPPSTVLALRELLRVEGVASWQMKIAYERERTYPCGERELFGDWGWSDPNQHEPSPRAGLELICDRVLAREPFASLVVRPDVYAWRRDRAVLGERANEFLYHVPSTDAPVVRTTLDLALQERVGVELAKVMETHRPALTMAMILDVESGDVLAVDAIEAYPIEPFAPVYHAFTPGSTLKLVTMAIALEEGAVHPDQKFEVGPIDHYRLHGRDGRGLRIIHEAEGSLGGTITAAESLAWSVNAGLVQIGLRVPAEAFRGYMVDLGYGVAPESGLGIERGGSLPPLPWSYLYTHASVTFGHELTTTLWQHAEALATLVRGGVRRPLRLVDEVDQRERSYRLAPEPGTRVFSESTCAELRDMMRLGATEGTGSKVLDRMKSDDRWASAAAVIEAANLELLTKTGTAQKVSTETCVHVELGERERWAREGLPATRARYRSLRGMPRPHASCYTSSMCVIGRSPSTGREIMVLVVTDEPRGKEKFGSKVSGPPAFALLAEALGLTRGGEPPEALDEHGFAPSLVALRNGYEQPWREVKR